MPMSTELTAELERLREMVFAVRKMLHNEDVEATLLLHQIAERILVLSEVDQVAADVADPDGGAGAEPPT
jgi:hypothetical protein